MTIRIKRKPVTSPSARSLKDKLIENNVNTRLLKTEGSSWRGREKDLLINWGCSNPTNTNIRAKILNKPPSIANASNKLKSFKLFQEHDVVHPWYVEKTDPEFIDKLYERVADNQNASFLFRTTATGYGGEGIHVLKHLGRETIIDTGELTRSSLATYLNQLSESSNSISIDLNNVKFVTEYFTAKDEFRVHVACGEVIFAQRKSLRTDDDRPENPDFFIRNHENGFIFQQNNIEVPEVVKQEAIKAVKALGLDFGAVDIRCKKPTNSRPAIASVLEVNSAPAVTVNTLETYSKVFTSIHKVLNESLMLHIAIK